MRMELIQPFINAADAVFAESLQAPTKIVDLSMDEDAYRRKGIAAPESVGGIVASAIEGTSRRSTSPLGRCHKRSATSGPP